MSTATVYGMGSGVCLVMVRMDNFGTSQDDVDSGKTAWPKQGIYMGLVGARFERQEKMEHGLMAVVKKQNDKKKGYGAFADDQKAIECNNTELEKELDINGAALLKRAADAQKFYGKEDKAIHRAFESWYDVTHLPTYEEVQQSYADSDGRTRYLQCSGFGGPAEYLDMKMFKARIRVSMELFLFDADKRAQQYQQLYGDKLSAAKTSKIGAYCHVVGLGTGVWSFERVEQNRAIVTVVKEIIECTKLQYIDCVYFGWFTNDAMWDSADETKRKLLFDVDPKDESQYWMKDGSGHRVDIGFGRREPAGDRPGYELCLLTAMYAWDSNSFPGNEYYLGMLSASGDPAAAACSTIPYVQNSKINVEHVNGENSHVFFYDPDSMEYECTRLGDMKFEENVEKWMTKSLKSVPYKRDRFAQNYVAPKPHGHSLMDDAKQSVDVDDAFLNVKAESLKCHMSTSAVVITDSKGRRDKTNVNKGTTVLELYAHIKLLSESICFAFLRENEH